MPKILEEGCIVICEHCTTKFSFDLSEVDHSTRPVPAGHSPEEEAYDKSVFSVGCPKCRRGVDVERKLGPAAKREIPARAAQNLMREDRDI